MKNKVEVGKYAPMLPLLQKLVDEEKLKEEEKIKELLRRCEQKGQYSKKDAQTIVNHLKKQGRQIRKYHCPFCNLWHITHKEKYFKTKKDRYG